MFYAIRTDCLKTNTYLEWLHHPVLHLGSEVACLCHSVCFVLAQCSRAIQLFINLTLDSGEFQPQLIRSVKHTASAFRFR